MKDNCSICGGALEHRQVTYTKEHQGKLVAIGNVSAEVCLKCGEEYFTPQVADELHLIVQRGIWPQTLKVPYALMETST